MKNQNLTQERLKELLNYDKETGIFTWIKRPSNSIKIGDIAGTLHATYGYIRINIDGIGYKAHRLAWLYEYGIWPKNDIDHINNIRHNNWINNLRDVTRSENCQNQIKSHKDNKTTGLLGTSIEKSTGKFVACIRANGITMRLGSFSTAQEAHEAYLKKKRELHSHNTL